MATLSDPHSLFYVLSTIHYPLSPLPSHSSPITPFLAHLPTPTSTLTPLLSPLPSHPFPHPPPLSLLFQGDEAPEDLSLCPVSQQMIPLTQLECPTTRDALPMCVITGRCITYDMCIVFLSYAHLY